MYFTSHRVGDLRRLVRQYNRAPNTVWPTGNYFKGGVYGTDQNLPPSQAERNNPDYKGCADGTHRLQNKFVAVSPSLRSGQAGAACCGF